MKNWMVILIVVVGGLAEVAGGLAGVVACAADTKPNILFIMADDLGYGDLGCYGQQQIQTPNIDQLAAEGLRFTQAYAGAPVCASSRCCLMTGKHNGHGRVRDNIPHGVFLRNQDVTLAEVLKSVGYRTGAIGKWSLGVHGSEGKPNDQGFDDWLGHLDQDQAHFYYPHYLWDNDRIKLLTGNRAEKRGQYTHDLFTERALEFIKGDAKVDGKKAGGGEPFFLYLAYTIPHWSDFPRNTPLTYIVPSDEPYTQKPWPQTEKNYAAMITRLDRDVGRIMKQLRQQGADKNTLVIFTSDNGPYGTTKPNEHSVDYFNSNGPLRGKKRDMYEGGVRVPFIARWPGRVPAGQISDEVIAFWDMLPTFAELAQVDDAQVPQDIDGQSALDALLGGPRANPHAYLYWDYGHSRRNYMQAVRMGRWKGIRPAQGKPLELYDLNSDLGETINIAANHPDIVGRLESLMQEALTPSADYPPVNAK